MNRSGLDIAGADDDDRAVGTALAEFELTDAERAVRGLEFADSELRVRPTRRSLVDAVLAGSVVTGMGVWAVINPDRAHLGRRAVRNPEANVTWGVVLIVLGVIATYGASRPVAQANADGVEVRGLLRSRRYPWAQVADLRVDVTRVGRSNVAVGGGSIWLPWRRRPFQARGVLQLMTGKVVALGRLDGRTSAPTLASDHPTTLKMAALARWREMRVGPPVPVAVRTQRESIWPLLLAVAGATAVATWAAGRPDADPFSLVLAVVFVVIHANGFPDRSTD